MPDEVVTQALAESAQIPAVEATAPVEDTPTQVEGEDVATYKKRLAGKDQALTATKKELDAIRKEAEDLKRWKAEIEEKNLSEYEALEESLATQQDEARQERLARQHPLYAQFRQDTANFDEEARAAAFEKFLDSRVAEVESAPRIDPNNPRREPVVEKSNPTSAEISERLKSLGNPFSR
jgi:hypothetical protein